MSEVTVRAVCLLAEVALLVGLHFLVAHGWSDAGMILVFPVFIGARVRGPNV